MEDMENEGAPAPAPRATSKKGDISPPAAPELVVVEEVVTTSVESPPEDSRLPVRIELSRLVFRAPMKNSQSVRYLQDLLLEAGYPSTPDQRGWLAEGTRDALAAFQESVGMPVTGEPDASTVVALFDASHEYVWDR